MHLRGCWCLRRPGQHSKVHSAPLEIMSDPKRPSSLAQLVPCKVLSLKGSFCTARGQQSGAKPSTSRPVAPLVQQATLGFSENLQHHYWQQRGLVTRSAACILSTGLHWAAALLLSVFALL